MEVVLISGFCSVKRMRVFDSPLDGTLIHRRLAPSRCWYSFTYPGRMESLSRKEGHKYSNLGRAGNELGSLLSESKDLTTVPTMPAKPLVTAQAIFILGRSEEHTSELQSRQYLVCRLLLEKKKNKKKQ